MALCCLIGCAFQMLAYVVILAVSALGLMYVVLKYNKSLQERWFSYIFLNYIVPTLQPKLLPFKDKLFQDLNKVTSADPELRNDNLFRILEIGVGQGSNLRYYPKNSRFISVEPNDSFKSYFEENRSQFPDLVVEKFVKGVAEDMKDIPDDSIDVVVCTHVLCSVNDIALVLKEVKRVLCKDGQFLVFEHIAALTNSNTYQIQKLLVPLWKVFFAGCSLACMTEQELNKAGFSKVQMETFDLPETTFLFKKHIFGKAIK